VCQRSDNCDKPLFTGRPGSSTDRSVCLSLTGRSHRFNVSSEIPIADCVINAVVIPKANHAAAKVPNIICRGSNRECFGWQCKRKWWGSNAVHSKNSVSKSLNGRLTTQALQVSGDSYAVVRNYRFGSQVRAGNNTCEDIPG